VSFPHSGGMVRLPVVLNRDEIRLLLSELRGVCWIVASWLHGGGREWGWQRVIPAAQPIGIRKPENVAGTTCTNLWCNAR